MTRGAGGWHLDRFARRLHANETKEHGGSIIGHYAKLEMSSKRIVIFWTNGEGTKESLWGVVENLEPTQAVTKPTHLKEQ